jgi:hypothetical protein
MPDDPPATPLTEAEREFLEARLRRKFDRANNRAMIDALAIRGLVNPVDARVDYIYWTISDAGRSALIETAVAERFATLDALVDNLSTSRSDDAIRELARLARDQERRLARLEQGGGAG